MEAIGVKNLRSLENTGLVDIKPITVLVGENSAGKSTFLRIFPLLRQSLEIPTRGPLLWYGRLVDFGSFEEAIRKASAEHSIEFSFSTQLPVRMHDMYPLNGWPFKIEGELRVITRIELSRRLGDHEIDYISRVILEVFDHIVEINYAGPANCTGLRVNKRNIELTDERSERQRQMRLLPAIPRSRFFDTARELSRSSQGIFPELLGTQRFLIPYFRNERDEEEDSGEDGEESYSYTVLTLGSKEWMREDLRGRLRDPYVDWSPIPDNVTGEVISEAIDLLVSLCVPGILRGVDTFMDALARRVRYIAPVRATADRYNRVQNLAIDEVDSQGANLAFFLNGLSQFERDRFASWTNRLFGFKAVTEFSGPGHISVLIRESDSSSQFNLADKGFGYSQILPVLAQIWHVANQNPVPIRFELSTGLIPTIVAIEQPELHLHPRFQALVVDGLADIVASSQRTRSPIRLLVETHSESILNRIGQLIALKKLSPNDVNVLIFEQDPESGVSIVKGASYDSRGMLTDQWPYGFFNME